LKTDDGVPNHGRGTQAEVRPDQGAYYRSDLGHRVHVDLQLTKNQVDKSFGGLEVM